MDEIFSDEIDSLYESIINGNRKDAVTSLLEMKGAQAIYVTGAIFYRLAAQHEDEHSHALLTILENRI